MKWLKTHEHKAIPNKECIVSIIVIHNSLAKTKRFFKALLSSTKNINFELIIVDTLATGAPLLKKKYQSIPTTLINKQSSTTKALNQSAKIAQGQYLVFMDCDTVPLTHWLDQLLELANEKTGAIGPQLCRPFVDVEMNAKERAINSIKNLWKSVFRKPKNTQLYSTGLSFIDHKTHFKVKNIGFGEELSLSHQHDEKRIAVSAKCCLISRNVFLLHKGLDDSYHYHESMLDLCLRLNQNGFSHYFSSESKVLYKPNSKIAEVKTSEKFQKKWFFPIKKSYWKELISAKKQLYSSSKLTLAIAVTDHGENVTAGDYYTAQELALSLRGLGWNIVFLSRLKGQWYNIPEQVDVLLNLLDEYDLTKIPKRDKKLLTLAWARNWFDKWCSSTWFNSYDLIFASSETSCDYIKTNSQQTAVLLPIATNPTRFETPDEPCNKYSSDICFTGSYWGHPRDIMSSLSKNILSNYDFHVYGANWQNFSPFKAHAKGFVEYRQIPNIYHNTKIVIDDANHVTKPYGSVNSRVFDALMSGALVITNGKKGSLELFSGELPYYETPQQLEDLLKDYLSNPIKRKKKVEQLKKQVIKHHTYSHRANSISTTLLQHFAKTSIAIKIPVPCWSSAKNWGDYHMAVLLKRQLVKLHYEVKLQVLSEWNTEQGLNYDVVLVFRGLSQYAVNPHQLNLMWNISHPDKVSLAEYQHYDKVFIASQYWTKVLTKQLSTPVECLLQCTDIQRFHLPSKNEIKQYKCQLLFVGNSRKVYRKIIKDLLPTDFDLNVYGNDWRKLIPAKYIKGEHIENQHLYRYYGSADILLNDHWQDMREKGFISNRIFDALASGATIMTDKVRGLGEIEQYLLVYSSSTELKTLIESHLREPNKKQETSKQGVEFIKNKHTFAHRAECLSKNIKALLQVQH